jgi:hypothetical protein
MGITLGYKRQEAVWMPLLANQEVAGDLIPQVCEEDECRSFVASTGKGGPAGEAATDTYSVLATFEGQAAGGATAGTGTSPNTKAEGKLAQYFATGFAARLLAASGSAVVNTTGETTPANAISAQAKSENIQIRKQEDERISRIMNSITNKDGTINLEKKTALIKKSKFSNPSINTKLDAIKDSDDFLEYISLTYDVSGRPLFDALD